IVTYDVLTGAVGHLPNQDGTDFTTTGGTLNEVCAMGEAAACVFTNGSTGVAQYQTSAFGTLTYQSSGWVVGSNLDFATPAIEKRFRTIELHHSPLNAGEQILVRAFLEGDPTSFTTSLLPSPNNATTNNTLNSPTRAEPCSRSTTATASATRRPSSPANWSTPRPR